jgi:hypothetical protein
MPQQAEEFCIERIGMDLDPQNEFFRVDHFPAR